MLIIRRMKCVVAASGIVTRPVHRLREFFLNLCTRRPLKEDDDTRCWINRIQAPDDKHIMLETCRGNNKRIIKLIKCVSSWSLPKINNNYCQGIEGVTHSITKSLSYITGIT